MAASVLGRRLFQDVQAEEEEEEYHNNNNTEIQPPPYKARKLQPDTTAPTMNPPKQFAARVLPNLPPPPSSSSPYTVAMNVLAAHDWQTDALVREVECRQIVKTLPSTLSFGKHDDNVFVNLKTKEPMLQHSSAQSQTLDNPLLPAQSITQPLPSETKLCQALDVLSGATFQDLLQLLVKDGQQMEKLRRVIGVVCMSAGDALFEPFAISSTDEEEDVLVKLPSMRMAASIDEDTEAMDVASLYALLKTFSGQPHVLGWMLAKILSKTIRMSWNEMDAGLEYDVLVLAIRVAECLEHMTLRLLQAKNVLESPCCRSACSADLSAGEKGNSDIEIRPWSPAADAFIKPKTKYDVGSDGIGNDIVNKKNNKKQGQEYMLAPQVLESMVASLGGKPSGIVNILAKAHDLLAERDGAAKHMFWFLGRKD